MKQQRKYCPRIHSRPVPAATNRQKIKKAKDLERVYVSFDRNGRAKYLGGYGGGWIYFGRAIFKDGSRHRVAIKFFKFGIDGIDDELAAKFQKCINDLRKAGVNIPKMAMVKIMHPETKNAVWVQVSELFGSTKKGSKFENKSWFKFSNIKKTAAAIRELTKIANAGYYPDPDAVEPRKDGKGIMVLDIESLIIDSSTSMTSDYVHEHPVWGKISPEDRARAIVDIIALSSPDLIRRVPYTHVDYPRKERVERAFMNAALGTASPKMRKALIEEINRRYFLIRVEGDRLIARPRKKVVN